MSTYPAIRRALEVPNLLGVKVDPAILMLRELGLRPIPWAATVKDVTQAGVVLRLDPPAGTPLRPRALIAVNVAVHPDFYLGPADLRAGKAEEPAEATVRRPEIRGCPAVSSVDRHGDVGQVQERRFPQMKLW